MTETKEWNTEPPDLSECETAEEAAEEFVAYLHAYAETIGQDGELEVSLLEPGHSGHVASEHGWTVVWEAGPFEWALSLAGGESLAGAEVAAEMAALGAENPRGSAEVDG